MSAPPLTLPDPILAWIEEVAGGRVTGADRVPGGASREAWFVDVARDDEVLPLFLRYSRAPQPDGSIFHPLRVEAEVFVALQDTEVTVPRTLGVHPTEEAMLSERVPGGTWFSRIEDPAEQVRVAQDFIRNLAALHRIDPRTLALPSLGPVKTAREHALDEIAAMRRRVTPPNGEPEPLMRLSLDWLERNVPDDGGPVVLVQGDTGPGNFMYQDGRVTAVVDWELAHLGDPMDDIAWLSLRTVQDTFTHFPDRLREYEELSGHTVDPERVWYYRLFAETRLASHAPARTNAQPAARDIGNGLIYGMLHRRLTLEALAAVMGFELPETEMPAAPPEEAWHDLYDRTLDNLALIVPRIDDPLAAQWTKGIARVVKYLAELDRAGRAFTAADLADRAALGPHPSDEEQVRYLWRQVQRDDFLMRDASGALRARTWPPLEG